MTEHVGYDKHAAEGRNGGNSRNGNRAKTVLTDNAGPVQIEVPRDRDGTFEPVIVKKRQRRLSDVDAVVLSLYAKGLTTGEISAHFAEVYGASVSKDTVSRITDKVIEEMQVVGLAPVAAGLRRGLHRRDHGQGPRRAGRQPAVLRRDRGRPAGHRDVLGLWAGDGGGESAKFWMARADRPEEPRRGRRVLHRL